MRRSAISALTVLTLVLAGCGAKDEEQPGISAPPTVAAADAKTTSLDGVKVSGDFGKKPEVSFEAPLVIEKPAHKVIIEGKGKKVAEGDQITAQMTMVSGTTGKIVESSYDSGTPSGFPVDKKQINESLFAAVNNVPVGSRVLLSINGPADSGQANQTLIYIVDIDKAEKIPEPLKKAEGKEQPQDKNLPQVSRDADGKPSVTKPSGQAPTSLTVKEIIQGAGPEVKKGQKVTVHYSGWLWDDTSKTFDSSWDRGQPFPVENVGEAGVIAGWNEALVGQKVGSQLLVIIPPDKGYGDSGSPPNIPPNATLIFVIDVLGTVG